MHDMRGRGWGFSILERWPALIELSYPSKAERDMEVSPLLMERPIHDWPTVF